MIVGIVVLGGLIVIGLLLVESLKKDKVADAVVAPVVVKEDEKV